MLDFLFLSIGITGVFTIALNFILEITNKLKKDHHIFAFLYFYGSAALFSYSIYEKIWLFIILNGFLTIVGIYGIYKVYNKNTYSNKTKK